MKNSWILCDRFSSIFLPSLDLQKVLIESVTDFICVSTYSVKIVLQIQP